MLLTCQPSPLPTPQKNQPKFINRISANYETILLRTRLTLTPINLCDPNSLVRVNSVPFPHHQNFTLRQWLNSRSSTVITLCVAVAVLASNFYIQRSIIEYEKHDLTHRLIRFESHLFLLLQRPSFSFLLELHGFE